MLFLLVMMLAFWVDQIQQGWNEVFQAAWKKAGTRIGLWERVRSKFYDFVVEFPLSQQLLPNVAA